jgi:hypothetical protein
MDRNVRFLAGGLASLAVASTITLLAPSAYAADAPDRPCGQPAVPAVYATSTTDPVLRTVPAVTHDEWRWQRESTTVEHEYARVVSAARTETDWTRPVLEQQWSRKVVDRAAVDAVPATDERGHDETVVVTPAVTVTVFEYVQHETGRTRWEDAGWNAETADGDRGKGWTRTGATREDVVTEAVTRQVWIVDEAADPGTPAVAELSHVEYQWSRTAPGPGWNGPLDSRPTGTTETTTTTNADEPAGAGWTRTATREVPAVVERVWADAAPAGYTETGASQVKDVTTEETSETSATAPAGDGWNRITGSLVVVIDRPETIDVIVPGSTEQVQVSPALPASEPCEPSASGGQVVEASTVAGSTYAEPGILSAPHAAVHAAAHTHHAAAAAASPATVLPDAGNPVSPLLLTAGLSGILGGSILVAISRRRRVG